MIKMKKYWSGERGVSKWCHCIVEETEKKEKESNLLRSYRESVGVMAESRHHGEGHHAYNRVVARGERESEGQLMM